MQNSNILTSLSGHHCILHANINLCIPCKCNMFSCFLWIAFIHISEDSDMWNKACVAKKTGNYVIEYILGLTVQYMLLSDLSVCVSEHLIST